MEIVKEKTLIRLLSTGPWLPETSPIMSTLQVHPVAQDAEAIRNDPWYELYAEVVTLVVRVLYERSLLFIGMKEGSSGTSKTNLHTVSSSSLYHGDVFAFLQLLGLK